jgi:carboxyl-terminal processing protease
VVLVNERTASASEVVAGALQDNDRALILGQNTFGKSLVQTVVGLPYGAGLTLTTARYYTPAGRSVQRSYEHSGLYDYFNYRLPLTGRDTNTEARTITNRPVFGGAGISPDESIASEDFTPQRAALLDPIFFFVREVIRGKVRDPETGAALAYAGSPQTIDEINRRYAPLFRSYALSDQWKVKTAVLDAEATFIARQLAYHVTLATSGSDAASRIRIQADAQVKSAMAAVPRAAALVESARTLGGAAGSKKKPARVAFPGGSR